MNERLSPASDPNGGARRYAMMDAWHPGIMLAYVAAVVVIACVAPDLPLLIACLIGGSVLLFQVEGSHGARTASGALVLGCAVMLLAPLFDTAGNQVLFAYLGRPYTFEALVRGAATGALVASMIVWFACLFRIVSADGIVCVFGRIAPRIGMVSSLVMQMIPRLARRAARVRSARIGAGLVPSGSALGARVHEAGAVFATVASDSLERSVVCADAMESRGYGTGARTNALLEPLAADERAFIACSLVLLGAFCVSALVQALSATQAVSSVFLGAYALFVFLPVLFNVAEDVRWRS